MIINTIIIYLFIIGLIHYLFIYLNELYGIFKIYNSFINLGSIYQNIQSQQQQPLQDNDIQTIKDNNIIDDNISNNNNTNNANKTDSCGIDENYKKSLKEYALKQYELIL